MAAVHVEENSAHATAIQNAVQSRLVEINWAPEENDTTLSDYITMMLISGKDQQAVQSELAGDLLGMSEDDPMVPEFTKWLFETATALSPAAQSQAMATAGQPEHATQDAQMDDANSTAGDAIPSGPKSMRNVAGGSRGRDKRMLGQMNRQLDRPQDVPDSLRRIKGAASGAGRINSHGAPRGPRNNGPGSGLQRMMNSRPGQGPMTPMMQPNAMMSQLDPQNQMIMMQMMEMQAQLMQQMVQGGGAGMPNMSSNRGRGGKPIFDRMDKRGQNKMRANKDQNGKDGEDQSGMDVDESAEKKAPFDTICYWNANCTNVNCAYAHQSPVAPPGTAIDMNDTCKFGAKCQNFKCAGRHPSPSILHSQQKAAAQFGGQFKQKTPCRFAPNCTRPDCPFDHSAAGGQNSAPPCRYPVCKNPNCTFSHTEGQKAMFKDKVWTANGADGSAGLDSKSDRFAELKANEGEPEELIKPEQAQGEGPAQNMDTEISA